MEEDKVIKNSKGQLSIFLGISLLVVITMLAFVINVGLFVKAKINLQNAIFALPKHKLTSQEQEAISKKIKAEQLQLL